MGIVFITVPGADKLYFASNLHERSGGKVDLVVIQKPKKSSLTGRLKRLWSRVGFLGMFKELWFGLLLRLSGARVVLGYFRDMVVQGEVAALPKIIETDSINSDEVYFALKQISPRLIVIWGSAIVENRILKTAEKAINLHMGHCPQYRGALANQHAVLLGDFRHVGATVHYASEVVDRGNILGTVSADLSMAPKEMFMDLNKRATELYIDIACKLFSGEDMPGDPQRKSRSKTLLLKKLGSICPVLSKQKNIGTRKKN